MRAVPRMGAAVLEGRVMVSPGSVERQFAQAVFFLTVSSY
jgi:hypothetical protein